MKIFELKIELSNLRRAKVKNQTSDDRLNNYLRSRSKASDLKQDRESITSNKGTIFGSKTHKKGTQFQCTKLINTRDTIDADFII